MNYCLTDTIYALSSGAGKGGVAVIRVSGKEVRSILKEVAHLENPRPRYAYFKPLQNELNDTIDQALVLFFEAPHSFTGEDTVEFQIHGGMSVMNALFKRLGQFQNVRPAERGEFSRRAVINGKMDLTQAEGIMDLVDAQTDRQRRQALSQMQGNLGKLYESWRQDLVRIMAYCEAFIDFPEEEIPPEKEKEIQLKIQSLIQEIDAHLNDNKRGQKLRAGFQIALIGEPNVGKSSLMNALTQKETAIVTPIAGTTRDVIEAHLDVSGFPVILADTAGLHEGQGIIEKEGISRAVRRAAESDLILHIHSLADYPNIQNLPDSLQSIPRKIIWNKSDLFAQKTVTNGIQISAETGAGIDVIWTEIIDYLKAHFNESSVGVITRERYRIALSEARERLCTALKAPALELLAEDLRLAARAIGRITGRIETEELLDVIFRDFCIGK